VPSSGTHAKRLLKSGLGEASNIFTSRHANATHLPRCGFRSRRRRAAMVRFRIMVSIYRIRHFPACLIYLTQPTIYRLREGGVSSDVGRLFEALLPTEVSARPPFELRPLTSDCAALNLLDNCPDQQAVVTSNARKNMACSPHCCHTPYPCCQPGLSLDPLQNGRA
jgi:hypothetical protein